MNKPHRQNAAIYTQNVICLALSFRDGTTLTAKWAHAITTGVAGDIPVPPEYPDVDGFGFAWFGLDKARNTTKKRVTKRQNKSQNGQTKK